MATSLKTIPATGGRSNEITRLASAGSAALAFAQARVGYGLFLRQFKETFLFSTTKAGIISGRCLTAFLIGALHIPRRGQDLCCK